MHLKPKIIAHETGTNNKITYILQILDEKTQKVKLTKLRYSEFKDIHDQIQKVVSKLKLHINLPQFPGRKLFGSTNKSQESIMQRKKGLCQVKIDQTKYLQNLLSIEKLHCLQVVKKHYIPNENSSTSNQNKEVNIRIMIDRYTLVQEVIIYYVRVQDLNSKEEWTFKTRYSQIKNVHDALVESKIKNLPQFPKKKMFGMTSDSPENIEKRREELERYFNQIFGLNEVMNSETLRYFVEQSKKQALRDKELERLKKKTKG